MSCSEKISDLRWHVASTGHRDFAVTSDHLDELAADSVTGTRFRLSHEPGTCDRVWIITCCGHRDDILEPVVCGFERRISETEWAAEGRYDLVDRYGVGSLIESIKLEPRREARIVWDKVGNLDIGEDE